jgi:hypothetical protein
VTKSPRRQEIIGVVGRLTLVEIDNPAHDEFVAIGVGDDRKRRERKTFGLEHQMVGDEPGRIEVLVQQRRRHRERFGRIVEPGLVGRVDRELFRRANIGPGQVADRVIVLCVAQSPRENGAGIARVAGCFVPVERFDPRDHLSAGLRFRVRGRIFRRHRLGIELFENDVPAAMIFRDRFERCVGAQVEIGFRPGFAVARRAVRFEKRQHGFAEVPLEGGAVG